MELLATSRCIRAPIDKGNIAHVGAARRGWNIGGRAAQPAQTLWIIRAAWAAVAEFRGYAPVYPPKTSDEV